MYLKTLFTTIALLLSPAVFAATITCPDLSSPKHPNPTKEGWQIMVGDGAYGQHNFTYVRLTKRRVYGENSALCAYDQGKLILFQPGKFNNPEDPSNWYETHEYVECTTGVASCQFFKH